MEQTILDYLEFNAERQSTVPAASAPMRSDLLFRDLPSRLSLLRQQLTERGLQPGQRAALWIRNQADMAVCAAAISLGNPCVPLGPDVTRHEAERYLANLHVGTLVTDGGPDQMFCDVAQRMGANHIRVREQPSAQLGILDFIEQPSGPPACDARPEETDTAFIIHTSGSTEHPKAVPVLHRAIVATTAGAAKLLALQPGERCLNFMPLHHVHGLVSGVFLPWFAGCCSLLPGLFQADCFLDWLSTLRPTWFSTSPAIYRDLLREANRSQASLRSESLRFIRSGSAPLDGGLRAELRERFGVPLLEAYGMSETLQITGVPFCAPRDGSVGQSVSPEIAIFGPNGNPVPRGEQGSIRVRGNSIMPGYLNGTPQPRSGFQGDWFDTGDVGRLDADGFLYLTGRTHETINKGGEQIAPAEVEAALASHSSVAECVVFGFPHADLGEEVAAVVVPRPDSNFDEADLRRHVSLALALPKVPAKIFQTAQLARNSQGKVVRRHVAAGFLPDLINGSGERFGRLRADNFDSSATSNALRSQVSASDDDSPSEPSATRSPHFPRSRVRLRTEPCTSTEAQLVAIWCEVLQLGSVGVYDDFFQLGGHSLLAARALARTAAVLQVTLPWRRLFETPTIAALACEIDYIRERERCGSCAALVAADRQERGSLKLSFGQQRMWFLEQLEGERTAYHLAYGWRLQGELNEELLRRALETIVQRHEPLRTTYDVVNGSPIQAVQAVARFEIETEDMSGLAAAVQETEIAARCRAAALRPFDLAKDLLLRAALLRLSNREHVFLLTIHHIATDGWSMRVLWRELQTLYDGDLYVALPQLRVRYSDYAAWQRRELTDERLAPWLADCRARLAGAGELELPTDRSRPARLSYQGNRCEFKLPPALVRQLESLSRAAEVTVHMTLLAAFQLLLSRYSGAQDFCIAVPIAGRMQEALEDLIGFFVNTLVLRADLSDDPTFRDFLQRVREASLAAYDHQELPFNRLVEQLRPDRDLNRHPLAQVLFQVMSGWDTDLALRGLEARRIPPVVERSRFDLEMYLWHQPSALRGAIIFSTDLFDRLTIEQMVGHYRTLLEGIIADPQQRLSELPLLTAAERRQLLGESSATAVEYPCSQCVHELFEQQVAQTPDAIAVVFADQQLTYRELNARANQLAHHLRELGVGPETLIGLCLDRSLDLIVGLLGILKAGGAYLPLDVEDPPARLEFMLRDAKVQYLVTRQSLRERLPPANYSAICLDTAAPQLQAYPPTNLPADVTADHLAYVIYTSGSTGQPKGVLIQQRAIARLVLNNKYAAMDRDRVFLQLAPISFDASTWEIWGALLHGARLIIAPEGRPEFSELDRLIQRHRVTTLWLTATLFNQIVEHCPELLETVAEVLTGGEVLSVRHIRIAQERLPDVRLVNGYGPTENTTFSTCYRIPRCLPADLVSIPIGRPIANTEVYVLDAHRQLVPIGVPGELYLGGAGLARGYLNRPQLTTEKFVPHPFDADPAARLYRTGDLVRWRADGNLEFLGRLDEQVKLRGFRIELGEIEAVLHEHPTVRQCVVTLREDRPGEPRLVGYCVPAGAAPLPLAELARHLRSRLPDYMVPAAFVSMESFPLTPSGKIDRRALPAPDDTRPELETAYAPPRTGLEEQLSAIWCEVLGLERVGSHDDFFALGGHSLLATRVIARVSAVLQVELPVRRLFELPTIAQLAAEISARRCSEAPPPTRALERRKGEPGERLPLSFGQQRLWFLEQLEGALTAYNIPIAWRIHGPLNVEALRQAFETIVERHEPLRTTFAMVEGTPIQIIQASARFDLPVVDLRGLAPHLQEAEVTERCRAEAERPFDLTRDLMLRAALLRLSADEQVLLVTMHHIASDGWSVQVLWHELNVLYESDCRPADALLGKLPVQYADYAVWQRQALTGPRLATLLAYWRQQLAGVRPLELPTDRPRPPQSTYRGARCDFTLGSPLVQQLQSLSQKAGVTLHMTLLAAFQTLLSRYCHQDDLAVATATAGRSHVALENLIGFFVNTLVLRTDLSGDPTFWELLGRVRQVALAAYDHQDLPFEQLVEKLQPERHRNRSPLADVLFQWLSFGGQDLALRQLEAFRLPPASSRALFDLELYLWQQRDGIRGTVIYSTDLFEASTIQRMVGHFATLLEGIVADPDRRISELPLLTERERQQLLVTWNDTAVEYPCSQCVHELFEQQVAQTPDAIAVVFADQQLTYRELNARANQLAHHLRELGVGPETLIGLCLDRSLDLIVGLLGILKAGGAYLPLDVEDPPARLEFMLRDAKVQYLVTRQSLRERLPPANYSAICLDTAAPQLQAYPPTNLPADVTADHLAYVIYTSGSTGQPKGVLIQQRALVNHHVWMVRSFAFTSADRFVQNTPFSFDASTCEFFCPLICGAQLFLLPPGEHKDLAFLWDLLREQGITVVQFVPSLLEIFLDIDGLDDCPSLKQIICGGEPLRVTLVERFFEKRHGVRLHNLYGPTEAAIDVTSWECRPHPDIVPIGRPIANTQVYVLDAQRQLVPIGVPGELYVGGAGLARGYLNRPELTAEKFVPHPFDADPAARLYRTGDLVRWRADGNLEFLGRLDEQVKLRGFRIELGEIEAVLHEHPTVRQCVVTLREDRPGEPRLVGYCVPAGAAPLPLAELARHLRSRLPDYMVPAAFVSMESFPLTPSGKIDRRALPAPDDTRPELETAYAPPRTGLEEQLSAIWCEVLGLERVGSHDDFFALGGHSLLAVRLFAEIDKRLECRLPLAVLFQRPTIAGLAQAIAAEPPGESRPQVVAIQPLGAKPPLVLMPSMAGEAILWKDLVADWDVDRPLYALGFTGRERPWFKDITLAEIVQQMVPCVLNLASEQPIHLAGHSFGGLLAYELARKLCAAGMSIGTVVIIDASPGRLPLRAKERLGQVPRFLANLPRWIRDDVLRTGPTYWVSEIQRKLRAWRNKLARLFGFQPTIREALEAAIDVRGLPEEYAARMQVGFHAARGYVAGPYAGRVVLLRARTSPLFHGFAPELGWQKVVTGEFEVREVPGNHNTLFRKPYSQILAQQLQAAINNDQACRSTSAA